MNIELFQKTLQRIEQHPRGWNQQQPYFQLFKPAACFVANAMKLAGDPNPVASVLDAQDVLDVDLNTADWLFRAHRTMDDFRTVGRTLWAYPTNR